VGKTVRNEGMSKEVTLMRQPDPETDFTAIFIDDGEGAEITGYIGNKQEIVIPSLICGKPVTSIGFTVFSYCSALVSVIIPDGVTEIGEGAFTECDNLVSVAIPASVKNIGAGAFFCCHSLTSVTFQGTIPSANFPKISTFYGDLRSKFYATDKANGTPGTYTRANGDSNRWTRQ